MDSHLRKKLEKQKLLLETRRKYESLFANMPASFAHHKIIFDEQRNAVDYKFLEVNKHFVKMIGLNKEDIIGKRVTELLTGLSQSKWIKRYAKVALTGESESFEEYSAPLDKWYRVNTYSQEKGYFTTVFYDITERKEVADKLKESEERFQKMLSTVPDMITMIDPDMNILYSNWNGFASIPEENREVETKCYKTLRGFSDICPNCMAKNVLESKEPLSAKVQLPDCNCYDLRVMPILNGQEEVDFFVEWVRDITEEQKRKNIIKSLHKIALNFTKIKDLKKVCEYTLEVADELLQFEHCDIYILENKLLSIEAESFYKKNQNYKIDLESCIDTIDNNYITKAEKNSNKSTISLPLGEYGIFQAVSTKEKSFAEAEVELLEILISHATAALERINSQGRLRYKTFHDDLTGLYNRLFLKEEMLRLDCERQLPISIILADINGLKLINDSLGHQKGDELLIKSADLLKSVFREEDILVRQGGDEFAVLLPQTNRKEAEKIICRLKEKSRKTKDDQLTVSMALGLAVKSVPAQNIEEVLKKADNNMYQNKLSESRSNKSRIVQSLLNTLEAKSNETKEHALRMAKLATKFGENLNLSNSDLNRLHLLSTLHDIGKTTIAEKILKKPGKLNGEEWEIIKKHSERGYKIANSSEEFALIAEEIYAHHERWDGSGYPRQIKGEEIPYLARIIAIIDAYDVMTNERTYKKAITKEEALEEIKRCAGSQFDPELAAAFIEMM